MNRPRRGRPRGPCRQEAPLRVRTPRHWPPAGAARHVFLRWERRKPGSADPEEAGLLLGLVVFGAAPAGQVSSQRLLQDSGTCSAGQQLGGHLLSPGRCWEAAHGGNKTLACPSSGQNPLDVTCVPSRPVGGSRGGAEAPSL